MTTRARCWVDFNDVNGGYATTLRRFCAADVKAGDLVTAYDGDGIEMSAQVTSTWGDVVGLLLLPRSEHAA